MRGLPLISVALVNIISQSLGLNSILNALQFQIWVNRTVLSGKMGKGMHSHRVRVEGFDG